MATGAPTVYQPKETEHAAIRELYRLLLGDTAPSIGAGRQQLRIPAPLYDLLLEAAGYMQDGKGVSVVPVTQELTTQGAANLLGVSRPFVVGLLKRGEIPFHKTGTHRRIHLRDLLTYRDKRDLEREISVSGDTPHESAGGTNELTAIFKNPE